MWGPGARSHVWFLQFFGGSSKIRLKCSKRMGILPNVGWYRWKRPAFGCGLPAFASARDGLLELAFAPFRASLL